MYDETRRNMADQRAILASLSPRELAVEYTRSFGETPGEDMSQDDMVSRIVSEKKWKPEQ
jgi:hypothetical protein